MWSKSIELTNQYSDSKEGMIRQVFLDAGIDPEDMPDLVHKDELAAFAKSKGLKVYEGGMDFKLPISTKVIALHRNNNQQWSEAKYMSASNINLDTVVLLIVV